MLSFLVGTWDSEGEVIASEAGPAIPMKGTDVYAWVLGGDFLHHKVDVMIGDQRVEVIELIGKGDPDTDEFILYSFDNQANVTEMHATLSDNRLSIYDKNMRSELIVSDDEKTMTAFWERTDDGKEWVPWMEMRFTKSL
jgi:hypothetical protein